MSPRVKCLLVSLFTADIRFLSEPARAALTKHAKPSDLTYQKWIVSQFWRPEFLDPRHQGRIYSRLC